MNKEQFFTAFEQTRIGFLTALQVILCITILPALAVVVAILWIDEVKD